MKVIDHIYDEDLGKLTVVMGNVLPEELEDILLICFNFETPNQVPRKDEFEEIIFE